MYKSLLHRALFYALVPFLFWVGVYVLDAGPMATAIKIFIFLVATDAMVTFIRRDTKG
ncbi:hypothetical protein [uncultured Brevundimonas sp.]|uniref:hypothetical protein n=1 Tax=uncultured Brevundimonas sp. TaxID=213418 RepID=UPI002627A8E5|nr:hypothetical protein [uncultured Brevundimonas sp.]